ncbi:hypothetical protein BofuT4_P046810.1 [Botrytis cinerea T4]|uniref:Uncharacterized protein n=1 Tax=Botryotinia fuckeliana (strain T4) TaxID=999810 RepID=G2XYX6_BOTF4|nr:hypothetical protein BofuT4_P046810.1 [Botrytis cinerea T4]
MSPPPRSFAECRQETAVRTCYQHHDLGFLCQLSHLGKHLTRPGSMNPAIFRDRGHYPVSADIGLCSDRSRSFPRSNPLESSYIVALGEAEALKVMMQISS